MDKAMRLLLNGLLSVGLVPLGACAVIAAAPTKATTMALVAEPETPTSTQYRFDFICTRENKKIAVEGRNSFVEGTGHVSELTRIRIDSVEVHPDQLAAMNKAFPAGAVQERPWITCDAGAVQVSIPYRHGSGQRGMLRFTVDAKGKATTE